MDLELIVPVRLHLVINETLKAMNNRLSVEGIFCDLEKSFDCVNHGILVCVNHGILVYTLEFYGISGKILTLIHSYLRKRYQKGVIVFLLNRRKLQIGFLRV